MPATNHIPHIIDAGFRAYGQRHYFRISIYLMGDKDEVDVFVIPDRADQNPNVPTTPSYRCRLTIDEFADLFIEYARAVLDE